MNHSQTSCALGTFLNIPIRQLSYLKNVVNTAHFLDIDSFYPHAHRRDVTSEALNFTAADQHPEDLANPSQLIAVDLSQFSQRDDPGLREQTGHDADIDVNIFLLVIDDALHHALDANPNMFTANAGRTAADDNYTAACGENCAVLCAFDDLMSFLIMLTLIPCRILFPLFCSAQVCELCHVASPTD